MKPGDCREAPPIQVGECYCCRRLFAFDDLTPVRSADSTDWRYICPLCRDVAKRSRLIGTPRVLTANRLQNAAIIAVDRSPV